MFLSLIGTPASASHFRISCKKGARCMSLIHDCLGIQAVGDDESQSPKDPRASPPCSGAQESLRRTQTRGILAGRRAPSAGCGRTEVTRGSATAILEIAPDSLNCA